MNADLKSAVLHSYRKTTEAVICGLLPDSPTATKAEQKVIFFFMDIVIWSLDYHVYFDLSAQYLLDF